MTTKQKTQLDKIKSSPFKRARAVTPDYFKKLMWIGGIIGTVSASIVFAPENIASYIPILLTKYAGYGMVIGYLTTIISSQTVDSEKTLAKLNQKED